MATQSKGKCILTPGKKTWFFITAAVCFIRLMLASTGSAAMPSAQHVTLLYTNHLYSETIPDLCVYGKKQGLNLKCLPLPGNSTDIENLIVQEADQGAVIFPAWIGFSHSKVSQRMVDLKPMMARETNYHNILDSLWVEPGGLITTVEAKGVFFNVTALRKRGISVPPPSYTWDDLVNLFVRLSEQESDVRIKLLQRQFGMQLQNTSFLTYYTLSEGASLSIDNSKSVYEPNFIRSLEAMRRLHAARIELTGSQSDSDITNGTLPVAVRELSLARSLPPTFEWQVLPLPTGLLGPLPPEKQSTNAYGIAGKGAVNEAWRILLWMVVGEGAAYHQRQFPLTITPRALLGDKSQLPPALKDCGADKVFASAVEAWNTNSNAAEKMAKTQQVLSLLRQQLPQCTTTNIPMQTCLAQMEQTLQVRPKSIIIPTSSKAIPTLPPYESTPPPTKSTETIRLLTFEYRTPISTLQSIINTYLPRVRLEVSEGSFYSISDKAKALRNQLIAGDYDLVLLGERDMADIAIAQGLVQPLDSYLTKEKVHSPAWSTITNQMRVNNQVYDLPLTVSPSFVVYNIDVMTDRGLALPMSTWTWDEFRQRAAKLTDPTGSPSFFGAGSRLVDSLWPLMVRQAGKGSYSASAQTYSSYLRLLLDMVMQDRSFEYPPLNVSALLGQVGMEFINMSSLRTPPRSTQLDNVPKQLGIITPPGVSPTLQGSEGSFQSLAIASTTKNARTAWQVAYLLSGPKAAPMLAAVAELPPCLSTEVIATWSRRVVPNVPLMAANTLNSLPLFLNRPYTAYNAVRQTMMRMSMAALSGDSTLEEAVMAVEVAKMQAMRY